MHGAFFLSGYKYTMGVLKSTDKSEMSDANVLSACTVSFVFKRSLHEWLNICRPVCDYR